MRDAHLRFGIDRGPCQRSHLSLVFCECSQVIIHKGDTDLAYEISPMYRESHSACMVLTPQNVLRQTCIVSWRNVHEHPAEIQACRSPRSARLGGYYGVLQPSADAGAGPFRPYRLDDTVTRLHDRLPLA